MSCSLTLPSLALCLTLVGAAATAQAPPAAAVHVAHLDGDDLPDRVVFAPGATSLELNAGDGSWTRVADGLSAAVPTDVLVTDLDGDGVRDVYVVAIGSNHAWVADGYGGYEDATLRLGHVDHGFGTTAERVDLDGEEPLDLLLRGASGDALYCTAWRITTGALLTAGHCVDADPDQGGPLLPDGVLDATNLWIIEFNLPASDPDGDTNVALPSDQFPVNVASFAWRFDGSGQGLGKDWCVFGVLPNAEGLRPHEKYGLPLRITRESPTLLDTIRVTGCGQDITPAGTTGAGNAANQTLQTDTGSYLGEFTGPTAADVFLSYKVDTDGGNSGSPILWAALAARGESHSARGC